MQKNRIPEAPHARKGVRGLLRVLKFDGAIVPRVLKLCASSACIV